MERDVLMYRAYIAQRKYAVVIDEVKSSSPSELQAVKLLAQYLHNTHRRCVVVAVVVVSVSLLE